MSSSTVERSEFILSCMDFTRARVIGSLGGKVGHDVVASSSGAASVSLGVSCRYGILMRSFYHLLFAHLILVCNFCHMIIFLVSIGITLGASSNSSWFW